MSKKSDTTRTGSQASVVSLEELAGMLPQYRFMGFLAEGGMGAVYLARQITLNRKVAIKILSRDWSCRQFARHFETEAQALARLSHPGIIAVHDFGETGAGDVYLVMEYVEGKTLYRLIRDREISEAQARDIALQLCAAVEHAHRQGILHRDLKPQNIMITESGVAKVMDFGLARPAEAATEPIPLGTPGYAAPELSVPEAMVDHRADVYALGVVIHEMLTGSRVDPQRLPLSAYGDFMPGWEDVIIKATAIVPEDRYYSVHEMGDDIRLIGAASAPSSSSLASRPKRRTPSPRKQHPQPDASRAGLRWLAVSLLLVVVLAAVFWWPGRHGDARETNDPGDRAAPEVLADHPDVAGAGGEPLEPFVPAEGAPGLLFTIPQAHRAPIRGLCFLPDQRTIASCSEDGTVILWDLKTRAQRRVFEAEDMQLQQAVASPDGTLIAACGEGGRVCLWSTEKAGRPLAEVQFPGGGVPQIVFSPDGAGLLVLTRHPSQPLVFWTWKDGLREVLQGWDHAVNSLHPVEAGDRDAFLTVGTGMDGAGASSRFTLGSLAQRRMTRSQPPLKVPPDRIAVSPDGATAAVLGSDRISIWDVPSGVQVSASETVPRTVVGGTFLHGGQIFLSGAGDGRLRLHEVLAGREVWASRRETDGTFTAIAASRDGSLAITGGTPAPASRDRFPLHVWHLPPLRDLQSPEARAIRTRADLLDLAATDPALSRFISTWAAEWDEKVTRANASAAQEVDQQYLSTLRQQMALGDAVSKQTYAAEISRTGRREEPPLYASRDWPEALQGHFKQYRERRARLPSEAAGRWTRAVADQTAPIESLRQARLSSGDAAGAQRVALLQECLATIKGELTWSRLQEAIRGPVSPPALSRALSWEAQNRAVQPVGPAITPVQVPGGSTRLQRPTQAGRLVAWKRDGCFGPMESALSDHLPQAGDVVAVSAGSHHALALRADGTVLAWGMRTESEPAMVPEGLDRVVAVSAGLRFDLALREDGSVVAWSPRVLYRTPPDMKPAVSIHNGVTWGCARHGDGSLTRLPAGEAAPLETGSISSLGTLGDVAVGFSLVLGITREGRLIVQGNSRGASAPVSLTQKGQGDLLSVACNHHEGAVLSRDGTLVVFGEAWRVAKLNGHHFPGADRVLRAWPAGTFAIHFPEHRWQFVSSGAQSGTDKRIADLARGCPGMAVAQYTVIAIRP